MSPDARQSSADVQTTRPLLPIEPGSGGVTGDDHVPRIRGRSGRCSPYNALLPSTVMSSVNPTSPWAVVLYVPRAKQLLAFGHDTEVSAPPST